MLDSQTISKGFIAETAYVEAERRVRRKREKKRGLEKGRYIWMEIGVCGCNRPTKNEYLLHLSAQ